MISRNVSVLFEFLLPRFAGNGETAAKGRVLSGKHGEIRFVLVRTMTIPHAPVTLWPASFCSAAGKLSPPKIIEPWISNLGFHNRPKNLNSIARRADSGVMQAARMGTDIRSLDLGVVEPAGRVAIGGPGTLHGARLGGQAIIQHLEPAVVVFIEQGVPDRILDGIAYHHDRLATSAENKALIRRQLPIA